MNKDGKDVITEDASARAIEYAAAIAANDEWPTYSLIYKRAHIENLANQGWIEWAEDTREQYKLHLREQLTALLTVRGLLE